MDIWENIRDYDGKYQISYFGEIKRVYKNGKTRILNPYIKSTGKRDLLVIGLSIDRVKKEVSVHKLVADAFLKPPKQGEVPYHINGLIRDNYASNIKYISRKELGKLTGSQSKQKGVAKINSDCDVVEFYTSARQAAKENFMSYQTVIDRCNNKVKSAFAPDGYAYAWEDSEVSMKHAIEKINSNKLFSRS